MKNIYTKITLMAIVTMFVFSVFSTVSAQTPTTPGYTVLAPLPGISGQTTLQTYLPAAFNLSIGIAAALAFVMITFGGIMYATSDAITGKSQGRGYIENALWGLLLVIGAYVILYTINPQILNFNLSLAKPNITSGTPTVVAGVAMSQADIDASNQIRTALSGYGITTNAGPCTAGQTSGCTNLNGLPVTAINGLIALQQTCGACQINITGGTEGGHITHGAGAPIVDLSDDSGLDAYLDAHKTQVIQTTLGPSYKVAIGGGYATFLNEGAGASGSSGQHWHVTFQ